jgi:transposase-like protein
MSAGEVYRGAIKCPSCKSRETGTSTIATSGRFIEFGCDDCGATFNVRASTVSSLSKSLRRLARGVSEA